MYFSWLIVCLVAWASTESNCIMREIAYFIAEPIVMLGVLLFVVVGLNCRIIIKKPNNIVWQNIVLIIVSN